MSKINLKCHTYTNKREKNILKFSPIKLIFILPLVLIFSCKDNDFQRSLQVELPNQENNILKTSQPGVGCWFWVGQDFEPGGYKKFIDLYSGHTNFRLLTTSIRHDRWVEDPSIHDQVKAAASYARLHDMGLVFDLDIRHSRKSFREQYPGEMQDLVRMREIDLKEAENVSLKIEGIKLGDHYTFGPAPDYDSYSSRLLRVYSYDSLCVNVQDISDCCKVQQAGGNNIQITIACSEKDRGRKACVMAAFTIFTPDVFSPHLPDFEKGLIKQYADVVLAGACKDEWGFPGRFDPQTSDLWYSESMAKAYNDRRPGHDLARDMLLMYKGEYGKQSERAAAINHYMQMVWQKCADIENHYYDAVKEVFGNTAMVMTHPTWVPFPDKREIFKNGLDWWAVKRDLAQTDESTPYCVRTALAKKWNSPLWYNMYYHRNLDAYKSELWQSLLGGGRLNYHQLFPYPDWLSDPDWNKALLKDSLMQAESRVQLLNYISTKPIDCPVALIFGHTAAINWTQDGFADVGLDITNKLWESGYYADLIPASEIASGALKISEDGSIQYGSQRYIAAVLFNPEFEQQSTADFFARAEAGNRTKLFRTGSWSKDFEGKPFDGNTALPESMNEIDENHIIVDIIEFLKSEGIQPYTTCNSNNAHYGASMVPGLSGQLRLLDGTVIHASGKNDVMGDPIQKTIEVNGNKVAFDAIGIAAVRLDENGELQAMAAGGLKSFNGGGVQIIMETRADVAVWKDKNGEWQGVLQDYIGPLPEDLENLCKNWARLKVPLSL